MKLTRKLAITILVTACAFSTLASAKSAEVNESGAIYQITTNIIKNTVKNVSEELSIQIQNSLLSVSHQAEIDTSLPTGKVIITDLAATEVEKGEKEENSTEAE